VTARVVEGWSLRGTPAPGESLEADVAFVVYAGLDSVSAVEERAGGFAVR
jgi:hypothetical protein